jgi:1,4-dihydroxy-2-naphthoyl-CoA hydrolase
MSIWFNKNLSLEDLQLIGKGSMEEHLGISWVEVGDNFLKASMPVDHRTKQPFGLLHGGASVSLAETIGSVASAMIIDQEKSFCVGMEINANHIRSVKDGSVTGIATPVHIGGSSHVWDIRISNDAGKLVCISRLTVAIIRKK